MDVATRRSLALPSAGLLLAALFVLGPSRANEPGTGQTALVERRYFEEVIDHHYVGLMITELAAGTHVDPSLALGDGASTAEATPAVEREAKPSKASKPEILALARRNNRTQRDEIATARRFLRDWYDADHEPQLTAIGAQMIAHLSTIPAGDAFDAEFLKTFSVHHAGLLVPTLRCQIGSDLDHQELDRYCDLILRSQLADIEEMRTLLCRFFGECGFVVPLA